VTFTRPWKESRNEIMFARMTGAGTPLGPSISHRLAVGSAAAVCWLAGGVAGKGEGAAAVTAALLRFMGRGPWESRAVCVVLCG
jgi:hypothetical protein